MRALRYRPRQAAVFLAALGLLWLAAGCSPQVVAPLSVVVGSPTVEAAITAQAPSHTPAPTATEVLVESTPTALPPEPTATRDLGEDDLSEYYGGLAITMDFVGQTLTMLRKQGFLLRLGDEFNWRVTFSPPDIVTENRKVSLEAGEQGVFVARRRGMTTLTAIGDPVCLRQEPACARPSVLFKMFIVVE